MQKEEQEKIDEIITHSAGRLYSLNARKQIYHKQKEEFIMLQEQNGKSRERILIEERMAKERLRLQEQIKKDNQRQRERERKLKYLIGGIFAKYLPDYLLFEEAEMERIIGAAMNSKDCKKVIVAIREEAAGGSADVSGGNNATGDDEAQADDTEQAYEPEDEKENEGQSQYDGDSYDDGESDEAE